MHYELTTQCWIVIQTLAAGTDELQQLYQDLILSSIKHFCSLGRKTHCISRLYLEVSSQCISLCSL